MEEIHAIGREILPFFSYKEIHTIGREIFSFSSRGLNGNHGELEEMHLVKLHALGNATKGPN